MSADQLTEWMLRLVMATTTVLVYLWGRTAKRTEAMLESQFELRDERIANIERRLDRAGQKNSDLTDTVQVLMTTIAKMEGRSDGERSR